ncbi:MAG: hypothetical protein AAB528_04250 [Chloroflexota bacterium]
MSGTPGPTGPDKPRKRPLPGALATWLALAALLISVGHVIYAVWRDHFNGGEGILAFFR